MKPKFNPSTAFFFFYSIVKCYFTIVFTQIKGIFSVFFFLCCYCCEQARHTAQKCCIYTMFWLFTKCIKTSCSFTCESYVHNAETCWPLIKMRNDHTHNTELKKKSYSRKFCFYHISLTFTHFLTGSFTQLV
jgi:hypothetical protein